MTLTITTQRMVHSQDDIDALLDGDAQLWTGRLSWFGLAESPKIYPAGFRNGRTAASYATFLAEVDAAIAAVDTLG